MGCTLMIIITLITYMTQEVTSQIYLPCDVIPVPGCSCHDPESPIVTCENLELTEVPMIIIPDLHTLDLSHNDLTIINHSSFQSVNNTKRLFLDYNYISYVHQDALKSISRFVEWIDFSDNKLYFVPDVFHHWEAYEFPRLKILNLAGNDITFLSSDNFDNAVNLEKLHLERNSISTIHSGAFLGLSMLRSLSISVQRGQRLIRWSPLRGLEKLEDLSVSWARPAQLDDITRWLDIGLLKNLKHLEFYDMNLQDYHFTTSNFSTYLQNNLRSLSLRRNNLTRIPNQIFHLKALTRLDLSDNLINTIGENTNDRDTLPNTLEEVNFARNNLSYVDKDVLLSLRSALLINLRDNKLTTINWTSRMIEKAFTPRMILELSGNRWSCSCENEWLKKLVRRQLSRSNGHLRLSEINNNLLCYSKVTNTFKRVADVRQTVFHCDWTFYDTAGDTRHL